MDINRWEGNWDVWAGVVWHGLVEAGGVSKTIL